MRTALTLALFVFASLPAAAAETFSGVVTRVHDGDTFTIAGVGRVRMFGIDAPELDQQCRADAIHEPGPSSCVPCGHMSRDALAAMTLHKEVHCIDRGKSYDRTVGECTVGDLHLGPWMLSHGRAVSYTQFLRSRDKREYVGAESGAKRAGAGIWSTTFIPPAEWRNHKARLECEQ
jgi:endonuclease YncB( thermonuclease family)